MAKLVPRIEIGIVPAIIDNSMSGNYLTILHTLLSLGVEPTILVNRLLALLYVVSKAPSTSSNTDPSLSYIIQLELDILAIPRTPQTFRLAKTRSSTRPMSESWSIHLPEAITRDPPMSRRRTRERKASRKMKRRAMVTFNHDRTGPAPLPSIGDDTASIADPAMEPNE